MKALLSKVVSSACILFSFSLSLFLFVLFFYLSSCLFFVSSYISSYIVAITDCHYTLCNKLMICHMQAHPSRNYISAVISSPNYTSLSSTVATFLATCLMAVLQPSGYSVFHSRVTSIQLSLPWQSYLYQCLNTETSTQDNRGFTTETPSISYTIFLYIRLVVTL